MNISKLFNFIMFGFLLFFYTLLILTLNEANPNKLISQEISSKQILFCQLLVPIVVFLFFKPLNAGWKYSKKVKIDFLEFKFRTIAEQEELQKKKKKEYAPATNPPEIKNPDFLHIFNEKELHTIH